MATLGYEERGSRATPRQAITYTVKRARSGPIGSQRSAHDDSSWEARGVFGIDRDVRCGAAARAVGMGSHRAAAGTGTGARAGQARAAPASSEADRAATVGTGYRIGTSRGGDSRR